MGTNIDERPPSTDEAWTKLLKHSLPLRDRVDNSIYAYLKPYVQVNDIVSETLHYAFTRQHQWENIPEERVINYLHSIAKFLIMTRARDLKNHREILKDKFSSSAEFQGKQVASGAAGVKNVHRQEKEIALERILGRIRNEEHKEIIRLVWLKGMRVKDAAEAMGKDRKVAAVILHRAMEQCRKIARRDSFAGFRISGETR